MATVCQLLLLLGFLPLEVPPPPQAPPARQAPRLVLLVEETGIPPSVRRLHKPSTVNLVHNFMIFLTFI